MVDLLANWQEWEKYSFNIKKRKKKKAEVNLNCKTFHISQNKMKCTEKHFTSHQNQFTAVNFCLFFRLYFFYLLFVIMCQSSGHHLFLSLSLQYVYCCLFFFFCVYQFDAFCMPACYDRMQCNHFAYWLVVWRGNCCHSRHLYNHNWTFFAFCCCLTVIGKWKHLGDYKCTLNVDRNSIVSNWIVGAGRDSKIYVTSASDNHNWKCILFFFPFIHSFILIFSSNISITNQIDLIIKMLTAAAHRFIFLWRTVPMRFNAET